MNTTELFLIAMVIIFSIPCLLWRHQRESGITAGLALGGEAVFLVAGVAAHGCREHHAHDPDGCANGRPHAVNPLPLRLRANQ